MNSKSLFKASQLPVRESVFPQHPLHYLASVPVNDARKNIAAIANLPYPADILVEPEFVGLTYFQVAVIKQAQQAALHGSLASLEFLSDRMIGRPAQVSLVATPENYEDFLKKIAETEEKTIDVTPVPSDEWMLE